MWQNVTKNSNMEKVWTAIVFKPAAFHSSFLFHFISKGSAEIKVTLSHSTFASYAFVKCLNASLYFKTMFLTFKMCLMHTVWSKFAFSGLFMLKSSLR